MPWQTNYFENAKCWALLCSWPYFTHLANMWSNLSLCRWFSEVAKWVQTLDSRQVCLGKLGTWVKHRCLFRFTLNCLSKWVFDLWPCFGDALQLLCWGLHTFEEPFAADLVDLLSDLKQISSLWLVVFLSFERSLQTDPWLNIDSNKKSECRKAAWRLYKSSFQLPRSVELRMFSFISCKERQ